MAILSTRKDQQPPGGLPSWTGGPALTETFLRTGALQIDYFLEARNGAAKTLVPFPSQPQNVQVNRLYYEKPLYTFGENFAFREVAVPRMVEVVLQGQTGVALRMGLNEIGEPTFVPGYEHLSNFEKFLDNYHHDAASHSTPVVFNVQSLQNDISYTGRPYLIFRGIKENLHGRCYVQNLSYQRSVAQHRMGSFQWSMTLMIYDTATAEDPTRFGFMDSLDNATDAVNQMTGMVNFYVDGFTSFVTTTSIAAGNVVDASTTLVKSVQAVPGKVGDAVSSVLTVAKKAKNFFSTLGVFCDTQLWDKELTGNVNTWNAKLGLGEGEGGWDDWQRRNITAQIVRGGSNTEEDDWDGNATVDMATTQAALVLEETAYQAWLLTGVLGMDARSDANDVPFGFLRRDIGLAALASLNNDKQVGRDARANNMQGTMPYDLRGGDNLLKLANRFMGSPDRWVDLASLNDAVDAYTKADGSPFMAGDSILIPVGGSFMPMNLDLSQEALDTLIGIDFGFTPAGDLTIDRPGAGLGTVFGAENMKQAVERLLKTATEEITMDPKYGLDFALIGTKLNESVISLVAARVREALLGDQRILDVNNIVIDRDPSNSSALQMSLNVVCVEQLDIYVRSPININPILLHPSYR